MNTMSILQSTTILLSALRNKRKEEEMLNSVSSFLMNHSLYLFSYNKKKREVRDLKKIRFIICLIVFIFPTYILIGPVYAFGPSNSILYQGIDVSGWQGTIDYAQVRNAGIEVVYMKASEGSSFIDPYFNQNYTNAKANGLKVGFYHYLTARSTEEAIREARFFVSVISGKIPDCRLAMDFESFGDLNVSQINQIGLIFMQTVQNLSGKEMVIYSDTSNSTSIFGGELVNYPLWVAQYEVEEPTPNGNWSTWARMAIFRCRANTRN